MTNVVKSIDIPVDIIEAGVEFELQVPQYIELISCETVREVPKVYYMSNADSKHVQPVQLIAVPLGGNLRYPDNCTYNLVGQFKTEMGAYTWFLFQILEDVPPGGSAP